MFFSIGRATSAVQDQSQKLKAGLRTGLFRVAPFMSIHAACRHITHYRFDRLINPSPHIPSLRPAPHSRTPIRAYAMRIAPDTHFINWQQDPLATTWRAWCFPRRPAS
ncbi:MAG: transglutaminase N-terminal domain-containing protein [Syntrophotaleaceae bacterium]